jgi:hypothetical protein
MYGYNRVIGWCWIIVLQTTIYPTIRTDIERDREKAKKLAEKREKVLRELNS